MTTMTTSAIYTGIPGLAVRLGRALESWGTRAGRRLDEAEIAWREQRRQRAREALADHDAIARARSIRHF